MFATLYAKLIAAGALIALLAGGLPWFGAHERGIGASGVQAQWDAAKAEQAAVVAKTQAAATRRVMDLQHQFDALSTKYEAATHVHVPQIADTVAAGIADGSVRLRGEGDCPLRADTMPAATARARAADAAATASLTQRVADSLAAVRVGDAADAREQQLREQVMALQGVLRAERAH